MRNWIFLTMALTSAQSLSACRDERVAQVGEPAPPLIVTDTDGDLVDMARYDGRPLILNFWLGGCAPCLDEMNELEAFHRAHGVGIGLLSVNIGTSGPHVKSIAVENGVSYDLAVDEINTAAIRYNIVAFPTTWLIDSQGILQERIVGEVSLEILEERLDKIDDR